VTAVPPRAPSTVSESSGREDAAADRPFWQRHRGLVIAAAVALIVVVTVLSDLPTSTTRASDIAAERSVMSEVNGDLSPCGYAVRQAVDIWILQETGRLEPTQRAGTPGILSDDQSACSLTNQGVYDLSDLQVPGTTAGKYVGEMVATTLLWTTSDALRVVEDVQKLMGAPGDAAARRDLAKEESVLASDRRTALAQEAQADAALQVRLPAVNLPIVPPPPG
jgi:hypothetical protein